MVEIGFSGRPAEFWAIDADNAHMHGPDGSMDVADVHTAGRFLAQALRNATITLESPDLRQCLVVRAEAVEYLVVSDKVAQKEAQGGQDGA
jgi:hypothetical protein